MTLKSDASHEAKVPRSRAEDPCSLNPTAMDTETVVIDELGKWRRRQRPSV